jgi:hypothetical protein
MRIWRIAGLTAAAALGLAGCGGSSHSGLTQAQLDTKVNAICTQYRTAVAKIGAPADFATNPVAAAAYLDKVRPLADASVASVNALEPPSDLKAQFDDYRATASREAALLRSAAAKAHARDRSGLTDIQTISTLQQHTLWPAARRLGFTACQKPAAASGTIRVVYDPPANTANAEAQQVLHLGGTDGLAKGFTHSFNLPTNITIHAVNQFVGPNWDPSANTITLSYPFVQYIAGTLKRNFPSLQTNDYEFGKELAAVDAFVLTHEFGHAFIRLFGLPVLGKEEDAADSLAAVFFTRFVSGGAEYAFDAAKFFHAMSARQRQLAPSDYWDVHSLDEQRAYEIVCWVAGSSQVAYQQVARLGVLGAARLQTCPAEYQQKVQSWTALLRPHVR